MLHSEAVDKASIAAKIPKVQTFTYVSVYDAVLAFYAFDRLLRLSRI